MLTHEASHWPQIDAIDLSRLSSRHFGFFCDALERDVCDLDFFPAFSLINWLFHPFCGFSLMLKIRLCVCKFDWKIHNAYGIKAKEDNNKRKSHLTDDITNCIEIPFSLLLLSLRSCCCEKLFSQHQPSNVFSDWWYEKWFWGSRVTKMQHSLCAKNGLLLLDASWKEEEEKSTFQIWLKIISSPSVTRFCNISS